MTALGSVLLSDPLWSLAPVIIGGMRHDPSLKRLIPLTPLRHFYDRLRDFCSDSFHREAARECLRRPDRLQELVAESVSHFGLYDNQEEPFTPGPFLAV